MDYHQHLYHRNMCYFGYLLTVLYSFNLLLCHHPISLPGCLQFQQSVHKGHWCSKGRQDTVFPTFWKGNSVAQTELRLVSDLDNLQAPVDHHLLTACTFHCNGESLITMFKYSSEVLRTIQKCLTLEKAFNKNRPPDKSQIKYHSIRHQKAKITSPIQKIKSRTEPLPSHKQHSELSSRKCHKLFNNQKLSFNFPVCNTSTTEN